MKSPIAIANNNNNFATSAHDDFDWDGAANPGKSSVMEELLAAYPDAFSFDVRRNTMRDGLVVQQIKGGYLVDLGMKCDSFVSDVEPGELEVGKTYQFFVVGESDEDGSCALSYRKAATWRTLIGAVESHESISAKVVGIAKSFKTEKVAGLNVYIMGVKGFIPRSELVFHGRLEELIGQEVPARILDANPSKGRAGLLVASQSKPIEDLQASRFEELAAGQLIEGTITKVIDAGALVDLGGEVVGLVYRTELGGDRNSHPSKLVQAGQAVTVKVVSVNAEKHKVTLSMRDALQSSFLAGVNDGDILEGTVARFEQYGAFIQLGGCIDGLLHITEYASRNEQLELGQTVSVKVKALDRERGRVSLTRRGL